MRIFIIIFSCVVFVIIGFNITMLSTDSLFSGDSLTAIMTILASLCALLLVQILRISKKIERLRKSK